MNQIGWSVGLICGCRPAATPSSAPGSRIRFQSPLGHAVVQQRIAVLARHAFVEHHQAMPTQGALDLCERFSFSDQNPQRLAIGGITALKLPQGERWFLPPGRAITFGHRCPQG